MDSHSQVSHSQESKYVLEGQLREGFGRVVYSHKTHEKYADILAKRLWIMKLSQIALSALITGSFVFRVFGFSEVVTILGVALSAILLGLNLYMKDHNLSELLYKHKKAAIDIWLIREKYQSLLTELAMGIKTADLILAERDVLMTELHSVYSSVPSTNARAYKKAQQALKQGEDLTFSDEEIDAFLPKELKRVK